jgi:hypothetical protein
MIVQSRLNSEQLSTGEIMSRAKLAKESVRLITLLVAILTEFVITQSKAEEGYGKACKVDNRLSILAADGDANACRTLALASNAQEFQLGCQDIKNADLVMLTKPIGITDKSARLRSSSLLENAENANRSPEEFAACAKLWGSR